VTKLCTATAVLLLQERGSLPLDDPMAKYLPPDLIGGRRKDHHRELSPIVASCVASVAIDPSRG
jgi:CubicO group peptidase (beta-lactamase class C family)